jgi:hypothetical protein
MLYTDMITGVLAEAPGCPRATAVRAIRNACMEWCRKTRCLTEGQQLTFTGIDLPSEDLDQVVYALLDASVPVAGEDPKPVLVTHMNDERLDDLDSLGIDYAINFADPANLQLITATHIAAPTEAAPITVDALVAYGPGPTSTEVPALLWQRYSEWLESGALYRVLAVPGKSWSNADSAAYHKTRFEAERDAEALRQGGNRENKAQRLTVTLPPF